MAAEDVPVDTPLAKTTNRGPLNEAVAGPKRPLVALGLIGRGSDQAGTKQVSTLVLSR